ncbi:MAG: DNA-processing protein DprA [Deltaproteobacteria bacterium]|nr:DNA-processing protein DprA [Deltaproteobacteria bacterium]
MTTRISSLEARFPRRLRYPRGPEHVEVAGTLAGDLDVLHAPVAIVGTRRPPPDAWRYAYWLAATLAQKGATIVSGGAFGIDAAAHEGALSVNGRTVAVLPNPLSRLTPAGNSALFRRILAARHGGLVGFLERDQKPRYHERNAAIAALSEHVVVVCAPLESGARNTAAEARRFHRPLWIVPGAPWEPTSQGSLEDLLSTSQPLISPEPLLQSLGLDTKDVGSPSAVLWARPWRDAPHDPNPAPPPRRPVTSSPPTASPPVAPSSALPFSGARTAGTVLPPPDEKRLLDALREAPKTIDQLVLRTGLPVEAVRVVLLTWTVEGVTREGPFGVFRLSSS